MDVNTLSIGSLEHRQPMHLFPHDYSLLQLIPCDIIFHQETLGPKSSIVNILKGMHPG